MLNEIITNKRIDRREFLKKSKQVALVVVGGLSLDVLLNHCTTLGFKEEGPVIYPHVGRLDQKKIQPPEVGCYIGFHIDHRLGDSWLGEIGEEPKIIIPSIDLLTTEFKGGKWGNVQNLPEHNMASERAITYLYKDISYYLVGTSLGSLVNDQLFKERLTNYAENIVKLKRPVFLTTMRELNADWFPWGLQSKASKAVWRHMWQIFEDKGANEYVTWVWEVYCPEAAEGVPDSPSRYYPGDKYVDWIGLSAYSREMYRSGSKSFANLVGLTYRSMRSNHRDKPVMMAEFGKTYGSNQHKWLIKAFEYILSHPGMKAAIYWNNVHGGINDDHTLTPKSLEVYKEIMKDPYFIGAK